MTERRKKERKMVKIEKGKKEHKSEREEKKERELNSIQHVVQADIAEAVDQA